MGVTPKEYIDKWVLLLHMSYSRRELLLNRSATKLELLLKGASLKWELFQIGAMSNIGATPKWELPLNWR